MNSFLSKKSQMKDSIKVGLERFLGYTILAITTAAIIPMIQIYTGALVCKQKSEKESGHLIFNPIYECFEGMHWLYIFLFIFQLVLHITLLIVSSHIFFDPNPVSDEPYAVPRCKFEVLNKLTLIIVPVAAILDSEGKIRIYLVMVLCCFFIIQSITNIKSPDYTKNSSRVFFGIADSVRISIYLGVVLNYYFNNTDS